jgi:hypothetical protein
VNAWDIADALKEEDKGDTDDVLGVAKSVKINTKEPTAAQLAAAADADSGGGGRYAF